MKKILLVIAFLISTSANANVFFSYCTSFNGQASGRFSSCVNRNFTRTSQKFDGAFLRSCFAFSTGSVFSFTNCVNHNFQRVQLFADGSLYLGYCTNFGTDELSLNFTNCVNRNFTKIATYINSSEGEESTQIDDMVQ